MLSTSERMQPTLPGVEETATTSSGVVEVESVDPVITTILDGSGDGELPGLGTSGAGGTAVVGVAGAGGVAGGATPAEVTPQVVPGVRSGRADGPGRATRCPLLLPVRQRHAAGRVVLRVRELWHHQRLLVI